MSDDRWRDPQHYARLQRVDRTGLMWEWLRRDPDYIAWHAQASIATRGARVAARRAATDPARWGIHFR